MSVRTIIILELFEYQLWEMRAIDVPLEIADSNSQDKVIAWYFNNVPLPDDVCGVLAWRFAPDADEISRCNASRELDADHAPPGGNARPRDE